MISPYKLSSLLQRRLEQGFHIVPRPDHPVLLSAPDLIIGGFGKLSAIFLVSKTANCSFLQARLTAARLALPPTTRMIAIHEEESDIDNVLCSLLKNFDEVQSPSGNFAKLAEYCSGDAKPLVDRHSLLKVKKHHSIYFATVLQITQLRRKYDLTPMSSSSVIDTLRHQGGTDNIPSFAKKHNGYDATNVGGSYVASFPPQKQSVSLLRTFWQYGMDEGFRLDTGIPYPVSTCQPNILLVDHWPTAKNDPDKLVRAIAFSGWIIAVPNNAKDIDELVKKSQVTITKRLA